MNWRLQNLVIIAKFGRNCKIWSELQFFINFDKQIKTIPLTAKLQLNTPLFVAGVSIRRKRLVEFKAAEIQHHWQGPFHPAHKVRWSAANLYDI